MNAKQPQGNEAQKIAHLVVPYTRGTGLDIGSGPWKVWPHAISVDNFAEWSDFGWRPDVQIDADDLSIFGDRTMDFVFSSHLLDRMEEPEKVLREWWRVLSIGGYLTLYLEDAEFGEVIDPAEGNRKQAFVADQIIDMMRRVGSWTLVEKQTPTEREGYSFFLVFRKEKGTRHNIDIRKSTDRTGPRTCMVIRYGGIGDMIQTASVLAALKDEGWYIVLNTNPIGHDILKEDPNVDEFWIQDKNQVPNDHRLSQYWQALGDEFDRVINLSESVEGQLLSIAGTRTHAMPKAARHMVMNVNYLEFMHALAGTNFRPRPRFFYTDQEYRKAQSMRAGNTPFILWALSGSSVHKHWPWVPEVCIWLMENTEVRIAFVGDALCALAEEAIFQQALKTFGVADYDESHEMGLDGMVKALNHISRAKDRLIPLSNKMSIRDTLTLAQVSDLVIGPETGVLNAVSMSESVAKVVFLSHSSHHNLTRDWPNTTAIEPRDVACYPCHRLHYDRTFCPQDANTGAAECAAAIRPEEVYEAIKSRLGIEGKRECRSISPPSPALELPTAP